MKIVEHGETKMLLFPSGKIYKCQNDQIKPCDVKVYTMIDPKTLKVYKYSRIHFNYKHFSASKLIATAFLPNPNKFKNVRYKDSDPANNSVENLEWININRDYGKRDPYIYKDRKISEYGIYNRAAYQWIVNDDESKLYELVFLDYQFRKYLYRGIWSKGVAANKIEDLMELAYEKLRKRLKDHYKLLPGYSGEQAFRKYCYFIFVYYSTFEESIDFVPREVLNPKINSNDYFDYLKTG